MNKTALIIFFVILAFLGMNGCSTYNGMVNKDENVNNAWSNVQTAYQERADLIPNLVSVVKGYANHEKSTLEAVVNARAKATSITIDPSNISPAALKQFQAAQDGLSGALKSLLVSVERYPDLKASEGFRDLQNQLEGMENRIRVERNRFNDSVTTFNKSVRKFPNSLYAGLFGFSRKATFEAQSGSQDAPKINFDE